MTSRIERRRPVATLRQTAGWTVGLAPCFVREAGRGEQLGSGGTPHVRGRVRCRSSGRHHGRVNSAPGQPGSGLPQIRCFPPRPKRIGWWLRPAVPARWSSSAARGGPARAGVEGGDAAEHHGCGWSRSDGASSARTRCSRCADLASALVGPQWRRSGLGRCSLHLKAPGRGRGSQDRAHRLAPGTTQTSLGGVSPGSSARFSTARAPSADPRLGIAAASSARVTRSASQPPPSSRRIRRSLVAATSGPARQFGARTCPLTQCPFRSGPGQGDGTGEDCSVSCSGPVRTTTGRMEAGSTEGPRRSGDPRRLRVEAEVAPDRPLEPDDREVKRRASGASEVVFRMMPTCRRISASGEAR